MRYQFVKLDITMTSEEHQTLFKCRDHREAFSDLGGIAFDIHKETASANSLCVWGGKDCKFNRLVDFIALRAPEGYQFAITGLLLETPSRQVRHFPSASIVDSRMIIIGRKKDIKETTRYPLEQLRKPFRNETWAVFFCVTGIFTVLALAIAYKFNKRNMSLLTVFFILAGERGEDRIQEVSQGNGVNPSPTAHEDAKISGTDSERSDSDSPGRTAENRMRHRRAVKWEGNTGPGPHVSDGVPQSYWLIISLLRMAFGAFVIIFMLFYEVAVVNVLFQQSAVELGTNVTDLSDSQLAEYAVLEASALEDVWNETGVYFILSRGPNGNAWRHQALIVVYVQVLKAILRQSITKMQITHMKSSHLPLPIPASCLFRFAR